MVTKSNNELTSYLSEESEGLSSAPDYYDFLSYNDPIASQVEYASDLESTVNEKLFGTDVGLHQYSPEMTFLDLGRSLFGGGGDDEPFKPRYNKFNPGQLSDIYRLATMGGADLFHGKVGDLRNQLEKRGVDPNTLEPFSYRGSSEDILNAARMFAKLYDRDKKGVMQTVNAFLEAAEADRRQALQEEAVGLAKGFLKNFIETDNYGQLIEDLRGLPASMPQEEIDLLKRQIVQQARDDELARQRKISAASGVRGMSGSSASTAHLAEASAAHADQQISKAFTQIELEKLQSEREDAMQRALAEADMLQRREQTLMQLFSQYQRALAGDTADVTTGLDSFSAYKAAQSAATAAEQARRDQQRTAMQAAGIRGVGAILSPFTFGLSGLFAEGGAQLLQRRAEEKYSSGYDGEPFGLSAFGDAYGY